MGELRWPHHAWTEEECVAASDGWSRTTHGGAGACGPCLVHAACWHATETDRCDGTWALQLRAMGMDAARMAEQERRVDELVESKRLKSRKREGLQALRAEFRMANDEVCQAPRASPRAFCARRDGFVVPLWHHPAACACRFS